MTKDPVAERDAGVMAAADALMDAIGVAAKVEVPSSWREDDTGRADAIHAAISTALLSERQRGREEMRDRADGSARIEGDQIVIRVSIPTIPVAFDACPDAPCDGQGNRLYEVTDAPTFAKGIVRYLNDEDEVGTTRIHRMLDSAMIEAMEQGEEGVEERTAIRSLSTED